MSGLTWTNGVIEKGCEMKRIKNQKRAKRAVAAVLLPFMTVLYAVPGMMVALALALAGTLVTAPLTLPFALIDFLRDLVKWCIDAEHKFASISWGMEMKWALLSPFNMFDQWDWFWQLTLGGAKTLAELWRVARGKN